MLIESLMTLNEVGELLGCSRRTVERIIASGDLGYVRIGGRRLVEEHDLVALIARGRRRRVPAGASP